jgi:hypothetical protein
LKHASSLARWTFWHPAKVALYHWHPAHGTSATSLAGALPVLRATTTKKSASFVCSVVEFSITNDAISPVTGSVASFGTPVTFHPLGSLARCVVDSPGATGADSRSKYPFSMRRAAYGFDFAVFCSGNSGSSGALVCVPRDAVTALSRELHAMSVSESAKQMMKMLRIGSSMTYVPPAPMETQK